ncbi:MAG: efflux RND transporter permease subunit, partial [Limisphaerales bacterium]
MTVVPLFCAKLIRGHHADEAGSHAAPRGWGQRFNHWFNSRFNRMLDRYEDALKLALLRPLATVLGITGLFVVSLALYPLVGKAYFPRTDPAQFVINLKAPTGTRIENTDKMVEQVEQVVREVVPAKELRIIVSNIGMGPGFSSIYTPNSGPHTAFVQVGLNEGHRVSSFQYMDRARQRLRRELPEMSAYFQTGGLVDAILNLGMPAPIDIQVSGMNLEEAHQTASQIARQVRQLPGVSDVLVPQDIDYPALKLNIDRIRASELGLNEKEIVGNVITALTSDGMIAPSYWVDPKSGNDYMLTVQYPENYVKNFAGLATVPLRAPGASKPTRLDTVSQLSQFNAPTEVDHYQLKRIIDVYVAPASEDLSGVLAGVHKILDETKLPPNIRTMVRGSANAMEVSFRAFGFGLLLATLLVYLILVAQFES